MATGLNPLGQILVALMPVLVFLAGLSLLDARGLVRPGRILQALLSGGVCALVGYVVNNLLLGLSGMSLLGFALLVAPVTEELLKALYCGWLVQTRRVGFLLDGAILGFAVGAGFALVENIYYLENLDRSDLLVWGVRGLGTAVMHGGTSALFTVLLKGLSPRGLRRRHWGMALAAAILVHAGFNRLLTHPVVATVAVLLVFPVLMVLLYRLGEQGVRRWLGTGMDRDLELLEIIDSGRIEQSPMGAYLKGLQDNFKSPAVADMLCLLRLQAELNLIVRGGMLLRENGLQGKLPPDLPERMAEVEHLQDALGRAGLLVLAPLGRWHSRRPWQWHELRRWLDKDGS